MIKVKVKIAVILILLLFCTTLVATDNNRSNLPEHRMVNNQPSVEAKIGNQPVLVHQVICGPSCIYLIKNIMGQAIDLTDVVDATPNLSLKDGCSLKSLEICAKKVGLNMRSSWVNLHSLENYTCPFILHTKYAHYVVISEVSDDSVTVCNPSKNKPFKITPEELREFANPHGLIWNSDSPNLLQKIALVGQEGGLVFFISAIIAVLFLYLRKSRSLNSDNSVK